MYNYCKADLYMTNLMLDHVQLIQKMQGQQIDVDYIIYLEHIAYNLEDISEETRGAFPEINWTSIDKLRAFISYEVYHFELGDMIEVVSDDILVLSDMLLLLRGKLMRRLESYKN
ncbi:hypothetical protein RyT2_21890 [Pseudolactococcus yaeyamensis]